MLHKILKLIPIDIELNTNMKEEVKDARVFNLSEVELKFHDNDFIIKTELGEITLEEGDELLIDHLLLKVHFNFSTDYLDQTEWMENDEKENPLFISDLRDNAKSHREHPLAFLFDEN